MARQRPPIPRRATWVAIMALVMIAASAAALAQVWTHLRAIDYGYKISKATNRRIELLESNRRLRIEVALLKSPTRIARLASKMGLQPPTPEQMRRVRLGPQSPKGQSPDLQPARDEDSLPPPGPHRYLRVLSARDDLQRVAPVQR